LEFNNKQNRTGIFQYCLSLFFIICSFIAASQNYIKGVINNESGKPVSFASVKFKNDSAGITKAFCIADVSGRYLLPVGSKEKGWIVFSATGSEDFYTYFQIYDKDTLVIDIILTASAKELPGITVKNKPYLEISGDTTFYKADRFKRGNESTVSELLSNIPGFILGPGNKLIYNGKIIDRILINGDDLTGANYAKLITSLDVTGIDQLQVIQNYSADDNLLNKLAAGNEQVLNIAYKKGFLRKFFGTIDCAAGLEGKHYNGGLQTMGLFDRIKILIVNRLNSVGKLSINPLALNMSDDIKADTEKDIELSNKSSLANISDMSVGIETISPLDQNNSSSSTLNFLIRPIKKLTIKGCFNFFTDRIGQRMDNTTTYFNEPALVLNKNNSISRRLKTINGFCSVNLFPDSRNQLFFSWKNKVSKNISSAATSLFGSSTYSENLEGRENQCGFSFLFNHLLPNQAALAFTVQYKYGYFPGDYSASPGTFSGFFNLQNNNATLVQQEYQKFSNLSVQIKAIKKINKHTFSMSIYGKNNQDRAENRIGFMLLPDIKWVGTDSVNHSGVSLFETGVIVQNRWVIRKNIAASLSFGQAYISGKLQNLVDRNNHKNWESFRTIPGVDVAIKISKKSRINVSYNSGTRFSAPKYTGNGFAIRDITSVYQNADTISMGMTKSLHLFYSHTDLLKKKRIIFSNLSVIRSPLLFLNNFQSFQSFAYCRFLPTDRIMQTVNLLISQSKFSNDYRTQFFPTINISRGSTYTLIQGKEEKISFNQIETSIGINTEVRAIQFKSSIQYTVKTQKYVSTITNKYLTAFFNINWKFSKRVFGDLDIKYNWMRPQGQGKIIFFTTSGKLQCKSANDKWEYGLTGTNLFNRQVCLISILTEVTMSNTSYKLFPGFLMAYIKYKF
jgi:hypothetical protein